MENLYDAHVVSLLKLGNSSDDISSILNNDCMKINVFFMLDYFNLLLHKRLEAEDKKYTRFLGLEENFLEARSDSISDKLLSLYCAAADRDDKADIFSHADCGSNSSVLSETPFLGLIQIVINPEYYKYCGYVCDTDFVDKFLSGCEEKICESINPKFENPINKYGIFRVLTSCNFYLVVRTASMEDIYIIAYIIDNITYQHGADDGHSYNMFSTYTNVGIEYYRNPDGSFKTFSENTLDRCKNDEFAVRLSCYNGYQTELIEYAEYYGIRGVFGKYDFLLRITMEDFAAIYPYLCRSVIEKPQDTVTGKEMKLPDFAGVRELLIQGLEMGYFKIANERALVYLNKENYAKSTYFYDFSGDDKNIINELLDNCRLLEKLEKYFTCGRRSFLDCVRAVNELVRMYSSLRFEADSNINWKLLCSYLEVLNKTVRRYIYDLIKHKRDAAFQLHFVKDLKLCVNAINQYIKFLQSVNQQTVQAPQYEIQTRVDSEMLMVAYMEYMNQFLKKYYRYFEKTDSRPRIFPIIYPDLTCSDVKVENPFNRYIKEDNRDINKDNNQSSNKSDDRLIICRIPSFEYFGRFYNLLPVITHEISHYIRILPRKERNDRLITLVFNKISLQLIHIWLSQNDTDSITYRYGLLKKELAGQLAKDFKACFYDLNGNEEFYKADKFGIDEIEETVVSFFDRFFDHKDPLIETEVNLQISLKEKKRHLAKSLMDLLYRYDAAEDENVDTVQKFLNSESIGSELKEAFENLMAGIADKVYEAYFNSTAEYKENCPDLDKFRYDDFIEEINLFNYKLQKLYNSQEKALMKPINKNGKIHMAILKDYCEEMKKLNYICFSFHKLLAKDGTERQKIKLSEIKGLENHLKEIVELYYDKRNCRYMLLDTRLNHLLITTGLTVDKCEKINKKNNADPADKEDSLTCRTLYQAMLKCGISDFRRWTQNIINLYRETSADIIMCRSIGFSPFGYFKLMFLTISDSMNEAEDYRPESINIQRIRLVLAVLLKSCGHSGATSKYDSDDIVFNAESLCKAASTYCRSLLQDFKILLLKEISEKQKYESFREDCRTDITGFFDYACQVINTIFASITDTSWTMISAEYKEAFSIRILLLNNYNKTRARLMDKLLQNYDYIFIRIMTLLEGLCNVMTKGTIQVDKNMFQHMLDTYHKCNFINQDAYSNQNIPIEELRSFYNNPDPSPKNFTSDEKLDYMIKFVENYYYLNRFEIMNSEGND